MKIGNFVEVFQIDGEDTIIITSGFLMAVFNSNWTNAEEMAVVESVHANDRRFYVVKKNTVRTAPMVRLTPGSTNAASRLEEMK